MTSITYKDIISIGELVLYFPALAIVVFFIFRDGIRHASCWYFLIIFTLARIVGACFQLATISNPTSASLYVGASICLSLGFSPLELSALSLLSRLLDDIRRSQKTALTPRHMKFVENVVTAGMIVGVVGGVKAGSALEKTGVYTPQALSKVGVGLFMVAYLLLVASTAITYSSISYASPGQKHILLAVAISLPFLLIRLIYSSISSFGHFPSFSIVSGSTTVLLCMALLMELSVVIIFVGLGLTLKKAPRYDSVRAGNPDGEQGYRNFGGPDQSNNGCRQSRHGRRTLIGTLMGAIRHMAGSEEKEMERIHA